MKTETSSALIQTHHFTMLRPGDKKKALEQVDLLGLTVTYSDQHELKATKEIPPASIAAVAVEMSKVWVVATINHIGCSDFFGDILLITADKTEARTLAYRVKERRPVEVKGPADEPAHTLDYDRLTSYTDCIYFERSLGKLYKKE